MDVVINANCETMPLKAKPLITQHNYLVNTLTALGCDPDYPPVADMLKHHHQLPGNWLIASPIHWQATHNDAIITATGDSLSIDDKLARIWFAEISQFLSQDGFELVYYNATIWMVKAGNKAPLHSQSVYRMLHQSLMPALSVMDPSMYWQRLLTELQMFMGSHPLNHGKAVPVNGLWFWGGGTLVNQSKRVIMTDDEVMQSAYPHCLSLDLSKAPPKQSLIIIQQAEPQLLSQLAQLTAKMPTHWYWNNLAYRLKAKRWWSRLYAN